MILIESNVFRFVSCSVVLPCSVAFVVVINCEEVLFSFCVVSFLVVVFFNFFMNGKITERQRWSWKQSLPQLNGCIIVGLCLLAWVEFLCCSAQACTNGR